MTSLDFLMPILPEIILAGLALVLLILGVYDSDAKGARIVSGLAILVLGLTGLVMWQLAGPKTVAMNGLFITDAFATFVKTLILLASGLAILLSIRFNGRHGISQFEYPVLILLATVGMFAMVSANDLISLYVGLELQSLALYVLAAFRRDDVKSSEAGLKYFVLGALSSGMLLFGASLIYGFAGSTNFDVLAKSFATVGPLPNIGLVFGMVFLAVGIAFKCSAVPFHMWTPDVYEGAPTPVTAFFAAAPKIAALALFMRVLTGPFGHLVGEWQQIIWALSAASMVLGALAAISQRNIKRLMAYSSINNVGYALIGLAAGTAEGIQGVLVYLSIYMFMTLGVFAVILSMERKGVYVEAIEDLAGLSKTRPLVAAAMLIFMFSMAGIPPFAGFLGKLAVFIPAIHAGLPTLAILGVVTSVPGAYYYLRIVKVMYFDAVKAPLDAKGGAGSVGLVMALAAILIVVTLVVPSGLYQAAGAAAQSLFGG